MGKLISVDFIDGTKETVFNPLEAWRTSLAKELAENGYTTELEAFYFPDELVDTSKNLYELNLKLWSLEPHQTIVLFRNLHFQIHFICRSDKTKQLTFKTLYSGWDSVLFQQKLEPEEQIIDTYFRQMVSLFSDSSLEKD